MSRFSLCFSVCPYVSIAAALALPAIAFAQSAPNLLDLPVTKLNSPHLTITKPIELQRFAEKFLHWSGVSTEKITLIRYFQAGQPVEPKDVDSTEPFCVFEKKSRANSGYDFLEYAKKHTAEVETFPAPVTARDPWVSIGGRSEEDLKPGEAPLLHLFLYFEGNGPESEGYVSLDCSNTEASPNQISEITGGVITLSPAEYVKGGKSDAELLAFYREIRAELLSSDAHAPSEAELRMGQKWVCEEVSFKKKSEISPHEGQWSRYADVPSLKPYAWGDFTGYTDEILVYKRMPNYLLGQIDGMFALYRALGESLLIEYALQKESPETIRLADGTIGPSSVMGKGWQTSSFARCRPQE